MISRPVHNDTRRIRRTLQQRICDIVSCVRDGRQQTAIETIVAGQTWEIHPGSPRVRGSTTCVVVSFTGVRQETPTLSAGGVTVETGILSANVVIPENRKDCAWDGLTEAYRIVGSITTGVEDAPALNTGDRITIAEMPEDIYEQSGTLVSAIDDVDVDENVYGSVTISSATKGGTKTRDSAYYPASVTIAWPRLRKGDKPKTARGPAPQTTTITITNAATAMPAYRSSDDLHIPVMIRYRADTEAAS